ncbi:putative S-adenosyl-l-methionine decarboxylase leader peptide [Cocos nucifera]|nr:putative S-adenosyl-l-methionine decarboxylase leader peptide [Cocos nucifera]
MSIAKRHCRRRAAPETRRHRVDSVPFSPSPTFGYFKPPHPPLLFVSVPLASIHPSLGFPILSLPPLEPSLFISLIAEEKKVRALGESLRRLSEISLFLGSVNALMESKGGKKKSSSSSLQYEVPLGYSIEDVRPNGGIKKFHSAAYSNCMRKPS